MTETLTPIMAHMVIGYPSLAESRKIADLYIQKGMEILELQIPFSHPTADGTVLTDANRKAVERGTTMADSLQFLKEIRADYPQQIIMTMTYVNKLFTFGIEKFCDELAALKIPYVIIPDLPFDSPIAQPIHQHADVQMIPVISANTSGERLKQILALNSDYIYIMADYKITGSGFSINPKIQELISHIKANSKAKVGLGFGISEKAQVEEVLKIADFAIIGSALTKAVDAGNIAEKVDSLVL
ncbi:MAG: tryptophan synthase subunit alpha [Flammeovirgaceae bacterium]